MDFERTECCGNCIHIDTTREHNRDFWCDGRDEYRCLDDTDICFKYRRRKMYFRDYQEMDDLYRRTNRSDCFITTIVCKMLGHKDDSIILNTLRDFRNNILNKNECYKNLLMEYDVVGPKIANYLLKENDKALANMLYNNFILLTAEYINKEDYNNAILRYSRMVYLLKEYFSIKDEYQNCDDYDYEKGGHGCYIKKK